MKKKECFFVLVLIIFIGIVCSPKSERRITRKRLGRQFIVASFIGDTVIDGTAKYYNVNNKLESIVEYKNGIKHGPALNFYQSGIVRDSVYYRDGLRHGKAFTYDSSGNLSGISNYFYGVSMGDNVLFSKTGQPQEYFFSDFYSNTLYSCYYDMQGRCKLGKSELSAITNLVTGLSGETKLNVFFYLPQPPNLSTTFTIGLLNEKNIKMNEFPIQVNGRSFIDTTLLQPREGFRYFISTHTMNMKDSINQVIVNELSW